MVRLSIFAVYATCVVLLSSAQAAPHGNSQERRGTSDSIVNAAANMVGTAWGAIIPPDTHTGISGGNHN